MFFPEFLYQLSARDQQVTWLDPVVDAINTIANSASLTVSRTLADDGRCLLLQAANVRGISGATQTCDRLQITIAPRAGVTGTTITLAYVAAALENSLNWTGSILIPPNWLIQGNVRFNSAVNANDVLLSLLGIKIPVANIQRV